ncbi:MAG: hypothetical protein ACOCVA_09125, partial [Prolixibacteraceae bacterium]
MRFILKYLTLFFFVMQFTCFTSAQVTKSGIDDAIDISSLQHPYLYFTEEEKPELLARIENDQECNDIFRKLKAQAQIWLHMPVDKNIP